MIATWMKVALAILVGLIYSSHQQGAPEAPAPFEPYSSDDPRCKATNSDGDNREFDLFGIEVEADGCYEMSVFPNDKGHFDGKIKNKCVLEPACPLTVTLYKDTETGPQPVAAVQDNLQGTLEKFASVVANLNCCLSKLLELPFDVHEDGIQMTDCKIFARHFPAGFPPGTYLVEVNQTCSQAFGEGYDGRILVTLDLSPN